MTACALCKVGDQNLQLPGMELIHPIATIPYLNVTILFYALDLKIYFGKLNHSFEIFSNLQLKSFESLDYKNIITILHFSTFLVH